MNSTKDLYPLPRKIGWLNKVGLQTLYAKEVRRFTSIYTQTIAAPVITSILFFLVFTLALGANMRTVNEVPYLSFLVPGLIMMSMAQNAFANTSSSILIGKMQQNIVDVLMPPLSSLELTIGYIAAGITRGVLVGLAVGAVLCVLSGSTIHDPLVVIVFSILGSMLLSSLGVLTGIWADKWDQMYAITNFAITPLTFLSGTFYSIHQLPSFWKEIVHLDPFFYMVDGFRYGFIGLSDASLWLSITVMAFIDLVMCAACYFLFRSGYRLKS